jgi:hypothetical protein
MQFSKNIQANWQKGYCFIMTVPHLMQLEQLGREFKNCSGKVETEVQKWLRQQVKDFCAAGFSAPVKQWDKCFEC